MLLGWTAIASATVPTVIVSLEEDRVEFDVSRIVSSLDGTVMVACSESRAATIVGPGPDVDLDPGGIVAADVSADGWLALAHQGGVTVHDEGGREILRLGGYTQALSDLALSPDGQSFAVAAADGLSMHRTADGALLWRRKGQTWSVSFHPDGKRVVAGIDTGNLVLDVARGKVAGGFDTQPATWHQWTTEALWTRELQGPTKAWDPLTFEAQEIPGLPEGMTLAAVHPTEGWFVADGCIVGADLCFAEDMVAAAFEANGSLWTASAGQLRRWQAPRPGTVATFDIPGESPAVELVAASGGDFVLVTDDGVLRRIAPDGTSRFEALVPGCAGGGCVPFAAGSEEGGGAWALGPDGAPMTWDSGGIETIRKSKPSSAIDAGRLADGRWVVLFDDGRVRIHEKFGKGPTSFPIPGAAALEVGQTGFVVIGEAVHPFDGDGLPRVQPNLGPDRVPRSVTVDTSGLAYAVLDDVGTIHRYSIDGRPLFRAALELPPEVDSVAWSTDGAWLFVGGPAVRVFDATDGTPHLDLVVSPPGNARNLAANPLGLVGLVQEGANGETVRLVDLFDDQGADPDDAG